MTWLRQQRTMRLWVAALCVLALACIGFGHRVLPEPAEAAVVDLAAYALPDGTLPTLCSEGGAENTPHAKAPICTACVLTASPGLLPCSPAVLIDPLLVAPVAFLPADLIAPDIRAAYVPHLRGPPARLPIA